MIRVTKYKNNNKFHLTLINMIYQFKCNKNEVMALDMLSRLLSKSSKKYPVQSEFYNEKLERYIINYSVSTQSINDVYFLNVSMLIPNEGVLKDFSIKKSISFLLDNIYKNNLNDQELFALEKRNYIENLLNNYKNIEFIANKNALDILDKECLFNKLKYKDLDNINNLDIKDVISFYNNYIKNTKPLIFINGALNIDLVDSYFDSYLKKYSFKNSKIIKNYNNFYNNYNLIEKHEKSSFYQSAIIHAYAFREYKEEDAYKLYLINLLLSAHSNNLLMKNLRKKSNLVYSVNSDVLLKNGLLLVKTMTNKNNISIVNKIISETINSLKNIDEYKNNIETIINNYERNMIREKDSFFVVSTNEINKYFKSDLSSGEELKKLKSVTTNELIELLDRMTPVLKYELEGEK